MSMKLYSPLRYPGGKNCIFKFISSFFYENSLIGIEYAEPFAGGGGLALHLLLEGYVSKIYLNDLDEWVYAFWYTILNYKDDFCQWIDTVSVDIETWRKYKNNLSNSLNLSIFEKAQTFFFLNRTSISGVIKGGVIGGIEQKGRYSIDVRFNKIDLINRINAIYERKSQIVITNFDGIDFLKIINRKHKDIFIYLDPPYVKKGYGLYLNFYKHQDHEKLAIMVKKLRKLWMISYDNCDLINALYHKYKRIQYDLAQCTSNRIGKEIIILPDSVSINKSVFNLKGAITL